MFARTFLALALLAAAVATYPAAPLTPACCPIPPNGQPVVNADQSVIMIWDAKAKMQHFVRKASFKSDAADFGFVVPTPSLPELDESGNEAFPFLQKLTEPKHVTRKRPTSSGCGCGVMAPQAQVEMAVGNVSVLDTKLVAGFQATVLEASSAEALTGWLKENGYLLSPAVQEWAKPYVEMGWKFTALKVAKAADGAASKDVSAAALRISFRTDRPLFPYREPDTADAQALGASNRLLRIYFLSDVRYRGEFADGRPWSGRAVWANVVTAVDRTKVLDMLKLPGANDPGNWWLTEFEDRWPYQKAPSDVFFVRDTIQTPIEREPIITYVALPFPVDPTAYALAAVLVVPPIVRRVRRGVIRN